MHKARSMAGYKTGTENDPEEEEEEENIEGNQKQQEMNPIGGSRVWEKEIAASAFSKKKGEPGWVWNVAIERTRRGGGRRRIRRICGG